MVLTSVQDAWSILEATHTKLKQILEDEARPGLTITADEAMAAYTAIYDICSFKDHSKMRQKESYKRYKATIAKYVEDAALPSLRRAHDQFLLKQVEKRWGNHKVMVRWMRHFFAYLDHWFIPLHYRSDNTLGFEVDYLRPVGWRCFVEPFIEEMSGRVTGAVIQLINKEREGEQIDRSLVKNVLGFLVEMGQAVRAERDPMEYYVDGFEVAMLQDTAEYYSSKAVRWIADDFFPDYMLKAEDCLKREKDRADHYLHSTTERKLLEVVRAKLISDYECQLLYNQQSGCLNLLENNKVDELARMYRLFSKVKTQGLAIAVGIFKQFVADQGMALVKETEDAIANKKENTPADQMKREAVGLIEQNFVWKLIEQHKKYLGYVSSNGCFNNDTLFHKALNESFEMICGKTLAGSTTAELLASFCDRILKKGGVEKLSQEAVEGALDSVVRMLAFIGDKDVFGEFYRKKLARRLLFDTSADEHERSAMMKLKQQCGGQFTSKMEGMLTDIALAREKQSQFENYLVASPQKKPAGSIDLSVTVLTTGFWPSYKSHDVNLPKEMADCVEMFKDYYQSSSKHKKLSWIYSMGSCNIVAQFEKKTVELVVTTYQACLLMLFNSCDKLSCSEIIAQLNLGEEDVIRLLHSLACAKYKILIKEPNGKNISKIDVFGFNSQFTDKMRRIKIPLPPVDEKKKVIEDVTKDRRYAVDAMVVRIMKSRKVMNYQQLVAQCVEQLRPMFKPDLKLIKHRIEDLINRDYLARDKQYSTTLNYVA